MSPPLSRLLSAFALIALLLASVGLSACGGGGTSSAAGSAGQSSSAGAESTQASSTSSSSSVKNPAEVIAEVGGEPVTKAEINHWMATLIGQGYYELSGRHTVPLGLVSEPADYPGCVKRLEAIATTAPGAKTHPPSGVELLGKCRQLYSAMRFEAAKYLIRAHWLPKVAAELGATATEAEALALYRKSMSEQYPHPGELAAHLAARRTSTADEILISKLDVLNNKILERIKADGPTVLTHAEAIWREKTNCRPGYVVEGCKQYSEHIKFPAGSLPPSVLLEQLAAFVTGRCTNFAACSKG